MKSNQKKLLIAAGVVVGLALVGLVVFLVLSANKKTDSPQSNQATSQTKTVDENAPTINLGNADIYVARAADSTYPANDGSTSCYMDTRNLTTNLNSQIWVYMMPEKCRDDVANVGWLDHNEVLFSFASVKQVADTGNLHSFTKTKLADDKAEAIIFKINRNKTMLDGTSVSWVQPAAIVETSVGYGAAAKKVYMYLTDDSTSGQIDYSVLKDEVGSLVIEK